MISVMRYILLAVALLGAGCGKDSPTAPTPPAPVTPASTAPTCFLIQNGQKLVVPCP